MRYYLALVLSLWCCIVQAADINLIIAVLECESSGKHNAVGDGGASYGIAQFNRETFTRFKRSAGHPEYVYENPIHQLRLMNWAIDNGHGEHWTCYRKITGGKNADCVEQPTMPHAVRQVRANKIIPN